MRKLFMIAILGLMFAPACRQAKQENPCGTVLCTAVFAAVDIEVTDANGQPVALDEAYTVRIPTGERITYVQFTTSGFYTILDDSYRSKLYNNKANFEFIGKKNGAVVVDEIYTISSDCCHVKKENGKEGVVVN